MAQGHRIFGKSEPKVWDFVSKRAQFVFDARFFLHDLMNNRLISVSFHWEAEVIQEILTEAYLCGSRTDLFRIEYIFSAIKPHE